jgi:hypothetical protein
MGIKPDDMDKRHEKSEAEREAIERMIREITDRIAREDVDYHAGPVVAGNSFTYTNTNSSSYMNMEKLKQIKDEIIDKLRPPPPIVVYCTMEKFAESMRKQGYIKEHDSNMISEPEWLSLPPIHPLWGLSVAEYEGCVIVGTDKQIREIIERGPDRFREDLKSAETMRRAREWASREQGKNNSIDKG